MSVPTLSRRRFLQGMGVAATGAVMAACAPPPAQQASGVKGIMLGSIKG